jgi:PAS domain S-box-containing protein
MKNLRFIHKLYLGIGVSLFLFMTGSIITNTFLLKKTIQENYQRELMNINESLYQLAYNTYKTNQHWVNNNLNVADYFVENKSSIDHQIKIPFEIENQITHKKTIKEVPLMMVDNNIELSKIVTNNIDLVDYITEQVGGTVTIFQLIDEGLLRVSTSVKHDNGNRAIGTYIPTDSPVYKSIVNGKIFRGRAFVVNDWYITAYKPIYNKEEIIGAIYVGVKQTELQELKESLKKLNLNNTYFPLIFDLKGNLIVKTEIEQKNIYDIKDINDQLFIKEVCNKIENKSEYKGEILYQWKQGDHFENRKMYYEYLSEMGWIISTSINSDVLKKPLYKQTISNVVISIILLIIVFLFVIILGKRFTRQLNILKESMTAYTAKNFDLRAKVVTKDELGELAGLFNNMADKLDGLYKNLFEKVEERTKELNVKNEEMQQQFHEIEQQNEEIRAINDEVQVMNHDLAESESKIRRLIDNLGEEYIFYAQALNDKYTFVSPSMKTILGYEIKEINFGLGEVLTNNPINEKALNYTRKTKNGIKQPPFEIEVYSKSGNKHILEILEVPVFNKNNEIILIEGIAHEITERKRSEQVKGILKEISIAVNECETIKDLSIIIKEQLHTIIDTSNFYVAIYDKKTDSFSIPFMADENDDIAHFPAGKTMTAYVTKTKKSLLATDKKQQKLNDKGLITFVGTPSKIWLGVPLIIKNNVIGVMAVQSYDNDKAYNIADQQILEIISGQIALAIERKDAEEKEKEQQDLFNKITSSANDAIIVINDEEKVIFWNPSAEKIFGYTSKEILGKNIHTLILPEEYKAAQELAFKKYKISGKGNVIGKTVELTALRKNGEEFPVSLSLASVKIKDKWNAIGTVRDVTERKIAEEKLKEEKDYAERILTVVPSAVFTVDTDEIITSWNKKAELITGWTAKEIIGKKCDTIELSTYAEDCGLFNKPIKKSIINKECTLKTKDGRIVTIMKNADYLHDVEGNIIGGIESFEDITKRKKAELVKEVTNHISNAVNTSENLIELIKYIQEELSRLLDTSNYYVALFDENSDTISMPFYDDEKDKITNIPASGTLTGYIIKKKISLLATDDDLVEIAKKENFELIGSPSKIWLGVPLIIQEKAIGAIAVQSYDDENAYSQSDLEVLEVISHQISRAIERKRNSDELKEKNSELSIQKEELLTALENLKDTQSQLIQTEKMAALGTLIAGIAHEINTPLGAINASVGNMSDSLETVIEGLPDLIQKLLNSELKLFLRVLKYVDETSPDLTSKEKRQLKKSIISILKENNIKEADKIAEMIIYMKLNNRLDSLLPLLKSENVIFILSNARNMVSLKKNTKNITVAVNKAAKVVFALKKFVHRDHIGEMAPADIIDGIETVLTLYHNQIKQGVEVIKEFNPIPNISCFADEINQIWTNLFHNSLQAMENKGTLYIKTWEEKGFANISVEDTGGGIPEEIRERIFEPFFTTKKAGEGSGLGLGIVKKIIDKHSGEIKMEVKDGIGTTFIISLPIV